MSETQTKDDELDQAVFRLAAMIDTSIRFNSALIETDEKAKTYLDVWLKKQRDPLLVTILATMTGARDPQAEPEQDAEAA